MADVGVGEVLDACEVSLSSVANIGAGEDNREVSKDTWKLSFVLFRTDQGMDIFSSTPFTSW